MTDPTLKHPYLHAALHLFSESQGAIPIGTQIGGILLVLGSSTMTNFGLTLQKFSHIRNSEKLEAEQKSVLGQPIWLFGFALFLAGQVLGLVAMGFCSQSLVATLSSFSLVTNTFFAPCFLGERPTRMDALSVAVIIMGSAIVVFASSHTKTKEDYDLPTLIGLYQGTAFLIYVSVSAFVIVAGLITLHRPCMERRPAPLIPSETSGLLPAFVAATMASLSVLFAKCSVHLLKTSIEGTNEFVKPLTYVILSCLVVCATQSVRYLNMALQQGNILKIIPFYFVSNTVLTIAGGLIYFQDLARMSAVDVVLFMLGVLTTIVGVYVASIKLSGEEIEEDDVEASKEDGDKVGELQGVADDHTPLIKRRKSSAAYSYAPTAYRASFLVKNRASSFAEAPKRRYSTSLFGGPGLA
mmetsp:Transcript_21930/g.43544  ORF Transcript_21930/g.43544 Transcript_21930/m.43544 type:complete len:411 (-) Transcript_21930:143-1375(-)